jgi:sarcosine oxidase, subunit gamma
VADIMPGQSALTPLGLDAKPAPEDAPVRMVEYAHSGKILLRGDPGNDNFTTAVRGVLGMAPPPVPLSSAIVKGWVLLWLGPDEWLIACPAGEEKALFAELGAALEPVHAALVDLTDAQTIIRISGPRARNLIAKGCTLDLHPRSFGAGQVTRSTLAHAQITLFQTASDDEAGGPAFDLYVGRSFAQHLWLWLEDAAREYLGPSG